MEGKIIQKAWPAAKILDGVDVIVEILGQLLNQHRFLVRIPNSLQFFSLKDYSCFYAFPVSPSACLSKDKTQGILISIIFLLDSPTPSKFCFDYGFMPFHASVCLKLESLVSQ